MNDEILKLAREYDTTDSFDFVGDTILVEFCDRFYRAAFNAGLEAAANVLENHVGYDFDRNICECTAAIRALEMKP